MITDRSLFEIYFSDLNVPIAYTILTIALFIICRYKKMPLIYTFFLLFSAGFGLAFLLDVIYDYQIKIFYLHNLTLTEGLAFLLFPLPTYVFIFYIWRFGEKNIKRIIYYLAFPIIVEISATYISMEFTVVSYSSLIRYTYVVAFIGLLLELKTYTRLNNRKNAKFSGEGVITT